jgi:hypothetical protein
MRDEFAAVSGAIDESAKQWLELRPGQHVDDSYGLGATLDEVYKKDAPTLALICRSGWQRKPWTPTRHHLWPAPARTYVHAVLWACEQLGMPQDVVVSKVLPHVGVRRDGPMSSWEIEDAEAVCPLDRVKQ